jgi:hypothetical protein
MVFKTNKSERIPKFNAPVFLENKTVIGTIDEIFGAVNDVVCNYFGDPGWILMQKKLSLVKLIIF